MERFFVMMNLYTLLPDELLLRLVKKSNQQAFAVLYNRYWEKLLALALNKTQNVHESEDIVHDVFLSLWNNARNKDISNVEAYLATAIKYKTFSRLKRISKQPWIEHDGHLENFSVPAETENMDELLHQRYLLEILQDRIQKLPPKCQLIFRYSRLEQLNSQEIAEKLGISKRTVENQLTKANRYLKPYFK